VIYLRRLVHAVGFACTLLVGAEIAARIDDYLHQGISPLASQDRERALVTAEPWGFHGRPEGEYRKWVLDRHGFRRTNVPFPSIASRPQLLILGASETFGLYESPGKEYPAQLAQRRHDYQVHNAAMAGITLKSMVVYWDNWVNRYHCGPVLLYPSPQFYLDSEPPQLPKKPLEKRQARSPLSGFRPRIFDRAKDLYHQLPDWAQACREKWVIERELAGKPQDYLFTTVPQDRLDLFEEDLVELIRHVQRDGAIPILATHAMSAAEPPRPEDDTYLRRMRMFFPRATPDTLVAFEQRANDVIRRVAKDRHLPLIDADRALSGRQEWFADLFHFNDAGAEKMAELLAEQISPPEKLGAKPCPPW
jgi:hypothetical protein